MSIKLLMPSSHLILYRPFLLLPPTPPNIRVFSNESALHIRWPKYCSFRFSISPSNEYSGLISFRIDWFDLLAVQGTLKSLLQHHSSKASKAQFKSMSLLLKNKIYTHKGKPVEFTFKLSRLGMSLGGPVVNTVLPLQGAWIQSLVGELRSHQLRGTGKKKSYSCLAGD